MIFLAFTHIMLHYVLHRCLFCEYEGVYPRLSYVRSSPSFSYHSGDTRGMEEGGRDDWVEHLTKERPLHLHVVIYLFFSGGSVFHVSFTCTGREETHGHINATHWIAKRLKNDPAAKHITWIGNSRRSTKRLTDFNNHLKIKSTIFKFKSRHFDVIIKKMKVTNWSS